MEQAVVLREQLRQAARAADVVPSYNDMVVKACGLALREHPRANAAYRDGAFELYERVNVGIAVAAQDSLIVPTVFDADRKSLLEIAREARGLAERVRQRTITPAELSGGDVHGVQPRDVRRGRASRRSSTRPRRRSSPWGGARARRSCATASSSPGVAHERHAHLRPPDPLRRAGGGVPRPRIRALLEQPVYLLSDCASLPGIHGPCQPP